MRSSIISNPYGIQTRESEVSRNIIFAFGLLVLRSLMVPFIILECWLIGRLTGLLILINVMLVWILWFRARENLRVTYPDLQLRRRVFPNRTEPWFELWLLAWAGGIIATVVFFCNWWPPVEWVIDGYMAWWLVDGIVKFNMQMWVRLMVIVFPPLICYTPWIIMDWVFRMELERPNLRNATPERMAIDGIGTPTTGEYHRSPIQVDPIEPMLTDIEYTAHDVGTVSNGPEELTL